MRGFLLPVLLTGPLPVTAVPAQSVPAACQPGFSAAIAFGERPQARWVRGCAFDAPREHWYLGISGTLFQRPDQWTWNPVVQLQAPEQIGLVVCPAGQGNIWCTALQSGAVFNFDPATSTLTTFAGVTNMFDLAVGPAGEVIVSANPLWPAANADTGLWHVGPQRTPREVLRLSGPSGPVLCDSAGNLLVAEMGRTIPPPPGAVRILRFPRARWQQALASHTTLVTGDADLIANGWNGAYGMTADDRGRLYVTDANGFDVTRTLPGTLQREALPFCTLPGTGLQLQFVPGLLPFVAFQPGVYEGALLVGSSNFISEFLVHRIAPERPALDALPGSVVGPGPVTLRLRGGPPQGLAFFAASLAPLVPEVIAARLDGVPLWSALDTTAPITAVASALDGSGNGTLAAVHPGGFALQVQWQALVLAPAGLRHCTSAPLSLQLLP